MFTVEINVQTRGHIYTDDDNNIPSCQFWTEEKHHRSRRFRRTLSNEFGHSNKMITTWRHNDHIFQFRSTILLSLHRTEMLKTSTWIYDAILKVTCKTHFTQLKASRIHHPEAKTVSTNCVFVPTPGKTSCAKKSVYFLLLFTKKKVNDSNQNDK